MSEPAARIFDRLIGRDEARSQVVRAWNDARLAHAYLVLGASGSGRTRFAFAVAQLALCAATPGEAPCGRCSACRRVARALHPDLLVVHPATREELADPSTDAKIFADYAASDTAPLAWSPTATIGIDQVRTLQAELAKTRVEAPRRVAILIAADRMTEPAAQAALKLLEEPPPETVLLLTAGGASGLLPTLVSRCQRILLRPLRQDELIPRLEQTGVDPAEAALLAALADGSLGRASELRASDLVGLRDRAIALFGADASTSREVEARLQALASGWDPDELQIAIELALLWLGDLARLAAGCGPEECRHRDLARRLSADPGARFPVAGEIRRRAELLEELRAALQERVNPELALHAAVARLGSGAQAGDVA